MGLNSMTFKRNRSGVSVGIISLALGVVAPENKPAAGAESEEKKSQSVFPTLAQPVATAARPVQLMNPLRSMTLAPVGDPGTRSVYFRTTMPNFRRTYRRA
jgi:hypothetical protein